MSGAALNRGKSKQDYATPPDFRGVVIQRFGMPYFDLAASTENFFGSRFYSVTENSLTQEWHKIPGVLWLNPPFDNIAPWAEKCATESAKGARVLFLTPASVGSNWFRDHIYGKAMVFALNGRIHFDPNNPTWGYPKDCILSWFGGGSGFNVWKWK